MAKLTWDEIGERLYETGVSKTVLYPQDSKGAYPKGVAWSGITSFNESPSGAEPTPIYADNMKYLVLMSAEDFAYSIGAYTYPDEWAECDGSAEVSAGITIGQQPRKAFGLCVRTEVGNDTEGTKYGYKLHLIYCSQASPTEKSHNTINESPEATEFSWDCTTTPVAVDGFEPTAHIVIDSVKVDEAKLTALEAILYGSEAKEARLPLPDEIIALMKTT